MDHIKHNKDIDVAVVTEKDKNKAEELLGFWIWVLGSRIHRLADEMAASLEGAAILISTKSPMAKKKLSEEQCIILEEFLGKASRQEEVAAPKSALPESILRIYSEKENSLIWLETSFPMPRKIQGKTHVGKKIDKLLNGVFEMSRLGQSYAMISRGSQRDEKLHISGKEFRARAKEIGQNLYNFYIKPTEVAGYLPSILDQSDVHLKIETGGRDTSLPWELLHNGGDFLCLRVPVARQVTQAKRIINKGFQDIRKILIVGSDPRDDLGNVEKEILDVSKVLKQIGIDQIKVLTGSDASKENLMAELRGGQYQVLHYSGHSEYDQENPEASFLLLQKERKLFAHELSRFCSEGNLRLVFLNSCSSGIGEGLGSGIMGLVDSFVKEGIPAVIGMLWNITGEAGPVLAQKFYENLVLSGDPAEALREARIEVGETFDWQDPTWAAPVIYT